MDRKGRRIVKIPRPFLFDHQKQVLFFGFGIKFREAKQIVVTFVAATLIALLSVAKTYGRITGYKLCTGNIYYPFFILVHISPISI